MDKDYLRLPEYLKRPIASLDNKENKSVRKILSKYNLNTVCDNARCPNKSACYGCLTATFLIMGKTCTRNCRFCNITGGIPDPLNALEPKNVANAIKELNLQYVVITSVTRDDIKDGGANHFAQTINEIRKNSSSIEIEILTPDFLGSKEALDTIIKATPEVFNHNMETVPRLYKIARPKADYTRSLDVLSYIKENNPKIITKTGIMVGLGETKDEIIQTMKDILNSKVDILTIGQYIRPSKLHLKVDKYYSIEDFKEMKQIALDLGFKACVSEPLARSSYQAKETYNNVVKINNLK